MAPILYLFIASVFPSVTTAPIIEQLKKKKKKILAHNDKKDKLFQRTFLLSNYRFSCLFDLREEESNLNLQVDLGYGMVALIILWPYMLWISYWFGPVF